MGLTYTRASDRTRRTALNATISAGEWLLVATSAVIVCAMALA